MPTILIVDDISANRNRLAAILGGQDHRLLLATNGHEALAIARAERPDLVITDTLMPGMDGYAFVRQLRLELATMHIPVVFWTAFFGDRETRAFARSTGVSDVLAKPADPQDVLRLVSRMLAGQPHTDTPSPSVATMPSDRHQLGLLNADLSEEASDLRSANARLRALINVGLELAAEPVGDVMLQRVCATACDLFGATYVTLGTVDRSDRTTRSLIASCADEVCEVTAGSWLKAGDPLPGFLATVVGDRQPMRGDNPGGDPISVQLPPRHPDIQAFVAAPIASPGNVYGWICLVGNEGRPFAEDDEHLLVALSAQVGRIYENLSLVAIAQKRADALDHEVGERREAESALRTSEERMRFAMGAAGIGIWDLDFTTGVLQWSEILESHYGLKPGTFAGTLDAFMTCVYPEDRDALYATIAESKRSGADFSLAHRCVWPDGSVRWLSGAGRVRLGAHGEPIRGIGVIQDVTEHHTLELQVQQYNKMEAVGLLAGGVAHDFNNLLTVILGYADVVRDDLDATDTRRLSVAQITAAAERAAGLTRQLLAFSRQQIIDRALLDLNSVLTGMREMLGRLIQADVKVVLSLNPDHVLMNADRGQIEQIVMNLVVNACDAMPCGGMLTIEAAAVELEGPVKTRLCVDAGPYVVLTVSDTGTGMTPAVQARLFEAFFTTKPPGKGTGLGLATVQGIARQSGGDVSVESAVGHGTSMKVYFPRAQTTVTAVAPPAAAAPPRASETILVVDDTEGICELTRRLLQRQGYTVLVALNARDALQMIEQNPSIDVLLTDVVMPGASGPELVRQVGERRPSLRSIYMSGYGEDAIAQRGVLNPDIAFLQKPFTTETLGRKIREVIERPA